MTEMTPSELLQWAKSQGMEPPSPNGNGHQPGDNSFNSYPNDITRWPDPSASEAFYGLAGDVVKAIAPHTEADPVALLGTFLGYFGNAVGRSIHAVAEADRHGVNLFMVLVGETARGRKGSSAGHIHELFHRVDPEWTSNRIIGGLSSGEGLIWAVRDSISKTEPIKEKGRHKGDYQTIEVDPGIHDKRLLVYESEFAGVLRVIARETNTLSALIRQAWDRGDLRTLTKNSPAKATGAHISIIGHITKDELLRYLDDMEAGNGFANRFLWLCVRRAQILPEGGGTPDYNSLVTVLHDTIEGARRLERIGRDDETREEWARIYPELSEGKGGMYGAITARAEAQVLRLSALYAALDVSGFIRLPHLKAALALWEYAQSSVRYIFGNATGDPIADRILETLAHGELTRTGMNHIFQRNVSAERIDLALRLLHRTRRAVMERRETNGRPVEVWNLL